jgi:hypothetical protein
MTTLTIRLARKPDGSTLLSCRRPDGSSTWQRREGAYFALHDLSHYAAETVLGLRYGFFGLLADGWNITDFGTRWPRGPIPAYAAEEAALAEHVAGALDRERAMGMASPAAAFNALLADAYRAFDRTPPRLLTDDELEGIRATFDALAARWYGLAPGEDLELPFPAPARVG